MAAILRSQDKSCDMVILAKTLVCKCPNTDCSKNIWLNNHSQTNLGQQFIASNDLLSHSKLVSKIVNPLFTCSQYVDTIHRDDRCKIVIKLF